MLAILASLGAMMSASAVLGNGPEQDETEGQPHENHPPEQDQPNIVSLEEFLAEVHDSQENSEARMHGPEQFGAAGFYNFFPNSSDLQAGPENENPNGNDGLSENLKEMIAAMNGEGLDEPEVLEVSAISELHADDVELPSHVPLDSVPGHPQEEEHTGSETAESPDDAIADAKPEGKGGGKDGEPGGGKNNDNGGGKGGGKNGGGDTTTEDPAPEDPVIDPAPDTGTVLESYVSGDEGGYNIEITFSGSWTPELQQAFIDASEFISDVILADIPDITGTYAADDLKIDASLVEIDGSGGILGQAGPTVIRSDSALPVQGIMQFDSADADLYNQYGLWEDIVLHEMMHTLGLGTLWSYMGLTEGSVENGDLHFVGENAEHMYFVEFYETASIDPTIDVETHGGSGTAGGHWDEAVFGNEIATGYINSENYVSEMTLASLEDLGYDTYIDNLLSTTDLTGPKPDDPLKNTTLIG